MYLCVGGEFVLFGVYFYLLLYYSKYNIIRYMHAYVPKHIPHYKTNTHPNQIHQHYLLLPQLNIKTQASYVSNDSTYKIHTMYLIILCAYILHCVMLKYTIYHCYALLFAVVHYCLQYPAKPTKPHTCWATSHSPHG